MQQIRHSFFQLGIRSYANGCAMSRKIKRYGWIPDLPDHRLELKIVLHVCSFSRKRERVRERAYPQPALAKLPKKVDLRPKCPPVFNQGELGSCTANAIAAAHQFDQLKHGKPKIFTPSRLYIYYNERVMEGAVKEDSGAVIRDGIKSLVKQGATPETTWPYVITKFATKPPKKCYDAGMANQALSYQRVQQSSMRNWRGEPYLPRPLAGEGWGEGK